MRVSNLKFFKNAMKNLFFYSVGSGYNFNVYRGGGLEACSSAFRVYSLAYFIVLAIKHQVSKSFTSRLSILGVHSGPFVCLFYTKSNIVFGERLLLLLPAARDFVSSSHFCTRQIHFNFNGIRSQAKILIFPPGRIEVKVFQKSYKKEKVDIVPRID